MVNTIRDTWYNKLQARCPRPHIGICYRGSPRSERPWSRDIDIELLRPIMDKYGPVVDLASKVSSNRLPIALRISLRSIWC